MVTPIDLPPNVVEEEEAEVAHVEVEAAAEVDQGDTTMTSMCSRASAPEII